MALGTFTVTQQYPMLGGAPASGKVRIDVVSPSGNRILDPDGNLIFSGPKTVVLDTSGAFTIDLPTDVTTGESATIAYRVTAQLKHNNLPAVEFWARPSGATVYVADIDTQAVVPLTPTGLSTIDAAATYLRKDDASTTYAPGVSLPAANGTNDTTAIQNVLNANAGKRIVGRPGSAYKISAPLVLSSGTTLDMTGCSVTLLPNSNSRMVQNAALGGTGARDTDIHVTGGYWDRGANGGTTSNDQHSFVFHRADRVSMTDMRFTATGSCKYAFYFVDVNDAHAERLDITSTSDGVHVTGPASRITVRDVVGQNDDDIISFTGRDYASFELTAGGGNISDILIERIVCRGGVDPNTVKLLPGAGMTLSNAVVRDISGSPATSAVVLYNDTVQTSTTGGTIDGVVIDGVSGSPGQRHVNVAHPDVRRLIIRNVSVTNNPTRAISLNGGTGAVVTDCTIDGVTAGTGFSQSLIHVGNPTTVTRLSISNVTIRSASGNATTYLLNTDGNINSLQLSNIYQENGYGGVVIAGGTCPTLAIHGMKSTASSSIVRVGASTPVEAHLTGITAYPTSQLVVVVGATASLVLRLGTIVDASGPHIVRTGTQTLRAIGAAVKVDAGILTPQAGDIVNNTNAARAYGTGPVISNGTQWKNLYTGTAG